MRFHTRNLVSAALGVFCLGGLLVAPTGASAAIVTTPVGLSFGDQYRLAFVTSTIRNALSATIGDYNTFVTGVANTQADLLALGATWTVIGSTSTVHARDNTGTNPTSVVPIYLLDGTTKIADNTFDLWTSGLILPLNVFEDGSSTTTFVWTGTSPNGIGKAGFVLGDANPALGATDTADEGWVEAQFGVFPGSLSAHFYALSSPLTVVPLPAALPLFLSALAGLIFVGRRRRKEAHA